MTDLNRDQPIKFGGAVPQRAPGGLRSAWTLALSSLCSPHAAAVHGLAATVEPVDLARKDSNGNATI
ncbi:hypothetical protein [Phenylobacterium sp.]|uniref:hypothetical protein n=1 Tax=Phenylobacterium sp. TaxID=1871053 RepID=UPI0039837B2B